MFLQKGINFTPTFYTSDVKLGTRSTNILNHSLTRVKGEENTICNRYFLYNTECNFIYMSLYKEISVL